MLEAAKLRNFKPISDIANKLSEIQQSTTITIAEASSHLFKQNPVDKIVFKKLQLICSIVRTWKYLLLSSAMRYMSTILLCYS